MKQRIRLRSVLTIAVIVIVIGAGVLTYAVIHYRNEALKNTSALFDPLNATYTIDGSPVTLVSGGAQSDAAPGSAEKVTTTVFGQPISGDLNGDGRPDAALILVQDSGGSGVFYYVAAAISTATGTHGTNAIFLGDRIAPQTMDVANERITANYADRAPTDPMSAMPSVGVTRYFVYDGSVLKEVSSSSAQ